MCLCCMRAYNYHQQHEYDLHRLFLLTSYYKHHKAGEPSTAVEWGAPHTDRSDTQL